MKKRLASLTRFRNLSPIYVKYLTKYMGHKVYATMPPFTVNNHVASASS